MGEVVQRFGGLISFLFCSMAADEQRPNKDCAGGISRRLPFNKRLFLVRGPSWNRRGHSFLPRMFVAGNLQVDSVQARINSDIQGRFLVAGAEANVAWNA
jgi:hypothetical protein